MSLDDPLFVSMSPDGSARRPGKCFCGQSTSNEDEAHCRACLALEPGPAFQPESPVTSEQMHDAGVLLRRACAPQTSPNYRLCFGTTQLAGHPPAVHQQAHRL